jgi:hypothetical protein
MFLEVACSNEECEQYSRKGQATLKETANMKPNPVEFERTFAELAAVSSVTEAPRCSTI